MYCSNCGAENDNANRFCVACSSTLSKQSLTPKESPLSFRERLGRLFGTTPRARLLSAGTAIAAVVAIVAFIALKPSEEAVSEDSYLRGLDQSCVTEKERISTLEAETLRQRRPDLEEFASVLVTVVAEWRSNLQGTPSPPVHAESVQALASSLLGVLIEAGTLARVVREGSTAGAVAARAKAVDEATARVDRVIEGLGLKRCMNINVGPPGSDPP
jgi:hypothetical protein